jgi:osmoprotectant transport system permease protein
VIALIAASGPVIPNFGGGGAGSCVRENRIFCWQWFSDNWGDTFQPALIQHIELTVAALAIGFVVSFAAALFAYRFRWFETPFSTLSAFLYTIPSLALFQVLVGLPSPFGLTLMTALVPLVTYTLLILFRNTLIGLREVPEEVREAARGMGLTRRQSLWRVEMPLALPAILAGMQIAAVTVVSLATIAAYVYDKGLGSPIFDAINRGTFKTELIAAGGMAIVLGILSYAVFAGIQFFLTPWTRARRT